MRQTQSSAALTFGRTVRKLFLSVFVIFTFLIYAVHERLSGPAQTSPASVLSAAPAPTQTDAARNAVLANPTAAPVSQNVSPTAPAAPTSAPADQPTSSVAAQPTDAPAVQPTAVPASPTAAGQYKDGQYTGSRVDAFYGWVQVQAVVQNGQISDVKFLEYPSDRQTSRRINSIAMPYLTSEAVQAQSASVDIISGATLTSEAFAQSLQAALQTATP